MGTFLGRAIRTRRLSEVAFEPDARLERVARHGRQDRVSGKTALPSLASRRPLALFADASMESTQKANARSCSKPIFLQALAPRYGHFVEELGIEFWSDPCSAINILTSLALLTSVRKIALPSPEHVYWRLENGSLTATGGSGFPAEFASPEFVETALRRVMQHAETVVLPRDGLMDTIPFVRGAGLTKLEMAVSSGDLPTLLSTIVDCPNLHTLHIAGRRDDNHTFRHAAYLPSLSHPTLRRLEISDTSGGEGVYDFVQRIALTLKSSRSSGVSGRLSRQSLLFSACRDFNNSKSLAGGRRQHRSCMPSCPRPSPPSSPAPGA